MLFPTIEFAVFFAVVFPLTWLLNDRNTWKKWFLVAVSYYFYAYWKVEFTLLLFGSSVFNYLVALALGWLRNGFARRLLLWFGVSCNLGLLAYFKYYNFFAASLINALEPLGIPVNIQFIEMALPIAISFLTFHVLSYIIDVYLGKLAPTKSLVDILLYVSFFPHLVAGPIVRAKIFLAQTTQKSDPADVRIAASVFLILGGLFKKVVIANYISTDFVDGVFRDPGNYSSLDLLLGMYAYAIQIYCDFSAYTDIAIGVARLLGYEFPQNFNQPYRATTVQDFWRRWHITLSNWLRDYLYIPLGGSAHGRFATARNVMVTMLLGGLWHGASYNFVIWGALHGLALVTERALGITGGEGGKRSWFAGALGWFITFHFVCITWVFFRSPTLDASLTYFSMLLLDGSWTTSTVTPLIACALAVGALTQIIPDRWFGWLERAYEYAWLPIKIAIAFAVIFAVSAAAPTGIPPFIYFQF